MTLLFLQQVCLMCLCSVVAVVVARQQQEKFVVAEAVVLVGLLNNHLS
jgi:hypothetical protein